MDNSAVQAKPLLRVIVKEELVELTGDHIKAIILNQFIYWSERTRDVDKYIAEEQLRLAQEGVESNLPLTNGWIYKKSDEMIEECLLRISRQSMDRYLKELVKLGYLLTRHNPNHKWDRTNQYRVDILKIQEDLFKLGYSLEGYPLYASLNKKNVDFSRPDAMLNLSNAKLNSEQCIVHYEQSNVQIERTNAHRGQSNAHTEHAIPEITTKINNDDVNSACESHQMLYSSETQPRKIFKDASGKNTTREGVLNTSISNALPSDNSPNDPYIQVDFKMSKHLGRVYIAKREDYLLISQLLKSGVPLNFILDGIDFTFENYKDRNISSFSYCAKVIIQRWALELAKRENAPTINWENVMNDSHHQANMAESGGDKYQKFYELFPDN